MRRLRQVWPQVRIVFRGDSGFCRRHIINWCERAGVHYIVGLARNARLEATVEYAQLALHEQYQRTGVKQRLVEQFTSIVRQRRRQHLSAGWCCTIDPVRDDKFHDELRGNQLW